MSTTEMSHAQIVEDLRRTIDSIYTKKITVGKDQLYAVSAGRLDQLSRRVEKLITAGDGSASPELLTSLYEEVESLKAAQKKALDAQKEAEAKSAATLKQLEAERISVKSRQVELDAVKKLHKADLERIKNDLKAAQQEAGELKIQVAAAKRSNDVEHATALKSAQAESIDKVNRLTNELQQVNSEINKVRSQVDAANKKIISLENEKIVLDGQAIQLKNALKAGEERGVKGLNLTPQIRALLGKEGSEILSKWHKLAYDNVREQSHELMVATSKSSSKLMHSISALFKKIWSWTRTQSYNARKVLMPFISTFLDHLESGKIRTISWYRDQLLAIQSQYKIEIARFEHSRQSRGESSQDGEYRKDYHHYYEEGRAWARVFKHRMKAAKRSVSNSFANFAGALKRKLRAVWIFLVGQSQPPPSKKGKEKLIEEKPSLLRRIRESFGAFHNRHPRPQYHQYEPISIDDVEEVGVELPKSIE